MTLLRLRMSYLMLGFPFEVLSFLHCEYCQLAFASALATEKHPGSVQNVDFADGLDLDSVALRIAQ